MRTNILLLLLIAALPEQIAAQQPIVSTANISINLASLYSGVPEVQADYFPSPYVGAIVAGGYLTYVRRGFIKVMENIDVKDASGAYFKIGIKGRYVLPDINGRRTPVPWIQVLYIYSMYDESGYHEEWAQPRRYERYTGVANGYAVSWGVDVHIRRRLDMKVGWQLAMYDRKDFFGIKANTFQPGIGTEGGIVILGLNYRLGNFPERKKGKEEGG